jgi:hypothetical protein
MQVGCRPRLSSCSHLGIVPAIMISNVIRPVAFVHVARCTCGAILEPQLCCCGRGSGDAVGRITAWPATLVKLADHPHMRVAAAAVCALGVKLLEPVPQVCERVSTSMDM